MKPNSKRGLGGVYQRGDTWWARYSYRGKKHRESSESSNRSDAVRLLKKRLGEIGNGRFAGAADKTTFEDLATILTDDYTVNERRSTARMLSSLDNLREFFGRDRAADITADRLVAYVKRRRTEDGAYPATVRTELAALKRAFALALTSGRVAIKPQFPTITVNNARTGFFEEGEFRAVAENLPPAVRAVAEFMFWTGWRKREVLTLQWRQVDRAAGIIRLEVGSTKTREGRTLPYSVLPELAALIERQRAHTTAVEQAMGAIVPWVFHRNGRPIRIFRTAWNNACVAAGVRGRVPHDFRRTAARRLVRAGVPEVVAMKVLGHKTRSIFDRYSVVNEADLAEGLAKVAAATNPTAEQTGAPLKRTGTERAQ